MRCHEAQSVLLDEAGERGDLLAAAREHTGTCAACSEIVRGWESLRSGFRALAAEGAPEPSFGFAARVARHVGEETAGTGSAFFESVGRRFVYAALLLAFTLFLVLVLPSTGPVRAPSNAEIYLSQPEAVTAQNDTIFPGQSVSDVSYRSSPGGPGSK